MIRNNYNAIQADLASEELFKDKILPKIKLEPTEVSAAYEKKNIKVVLNWLYAPTPESLISYAQLFRQGASFDSLYSLQFRDNIMTDERSMTSDFFKLEQKSSDIAKEIDTLRIGMHSGPVKGQDGWYIFKVVNKWKEISLTELQVSQNKSEVETSLKKIKGDSVSSLFVDSLLSSVKPIIKGNAFVLLRSYLGNYLLDDNKFNEWKLQEKGDSAITKSVTAGKDLNNVVLVEVKDGYYTIGDFINWYQVRSQHIKTDKRTFNTFSASVESLIWKMLRDNLLTKVSLAEGYQNKKEVKEQLSWWKDKLLYAAVREEISSSVMLNHKDDLKEAYDEKFNIEMNRKLLTKINILKKKYDISIDHKLLDKIKVDDQSNSKAIDIYAAKTGGIFPRPAYPSIDFMWESWQ